MRKKAFFILFIVLIGALFYPIVNIPEAVVNAEPVTGIEVESFIAPPLIFEDTDDYIMLNDTRGVAVEFHKLARGYNKLYNMSGDVIVYDERHFVEYWKSSGQGSWNPRGVPYNLTIFHVR